MRRVILYIGISVDGYIADSDGKVDWMVGQDPSFNDLDSYDSFVQQVDTVLMGANTYQQIISELSPEKWVYAGLTSYIFTREKQKSTSNIIFTRRDPYELIDELKRKNGKDIWICGGAQLIQSLLCRDAIDVFIFSVIPTVLGDGLRLFDKMDREIKLKLKNMQSRNGIVELVYERKDSVHPCQNEDVRNMKKDLPKVP